MKVKIKDIFKKNVNDIRKEYYITDKDGDLIVLIFGINYNKPVAYAKCNLQCEEENVSYILSEGMIKLLGNKGLLVNVVK